MPWQLTTPVDVGNLDVADYNQIKIVRMVHATQSPERIEVQIEYGRTVNNVWTRGMDPVGKQTYFIIEGQAYQDLVTTHVPNAQEKTYEAVKRGLYEWLNDNDHIADGSVV